MISPDGNPVLIQFGDGVSQGSGPQPRTKKTQNYISYKEASANNAWVGGCIAQR